MSVKQSGAGAAVMSKGMKGTVDLSGAALLGAGLDFIASVSPAASASAVLNSCFSATYGSYLIVADLTGSAGTTLTMRLRASATDDTSANYSHQRSNVAGATYTGQQVTAATSSSVAGLHTGRCSFSGLVTGPAIAQATSGIWSSQYGAAGAPNIDQYATQHNVATAYDGFSLTTASGTMTGIVRVYGLRNS